MKLNFNDFSRKCQFPLMLAAAYMPVLLLVLAHYLPGCVNTTLLLAGVYVVLTWLCTVIPGKIRVVTGVVLAIGQMALGVALLPMNESGAVWVVLAAFAVLLMGSLQTCGLPRGREIHPMAGALGLIAHLVAQMLVNADKGQKAPVYAPIVPALTGCFLVFAALSLLSLNRISLNSAVNGQQSVPTAMRRKNKMMTVAIMVLTLLIAALPQVIRAIQKAWQWLMTAIIMLIHLLLSLLPGSEGTGGQGGGNPLEGLGGEMREQGLFARIMEIVMLVLAFIIIAVGVFFAARIIWRKLKIFARYLWKRLNAYMVASSEDYVDEVSDTRDGAQTERALSRLRKRMQRKKVDESTLSPKERIRYRYLMHWMKHPEWTPERTARENLSDGAAQIYERARYSSHEVTQRDADAFAQNLEARKG